MCLPAVLRTVILLQRPRQSAPGFSRFLPGFIFLFFFVPVFAGFTKVASRFWPVRFVFLPGQFNLHRVQAQQGELPAHELQSTGLVHRRPVTQRQGKKGKEPGCFMPRWDASGFCRYIGQAPSRAGPVFAGFWVLPIFSGRLIPVWQWLPSGLWRVSLSRPRLTVQGAG